MDDSYLRTYLGDKIMRIPKIKKIKTLDELMSADFKYLSGSIPSMMYKQEGERAMIFQYLGKEMFRMVYDGDEVYVRWLLKQKEDLEDVEY